MRGEQCTPAARGGHGCLCHGRPPAKARAREQTQLHTTALTEHSRACGHSTVIEVRTWQLLGWVCQGDLSGTTEVSAPWFGDIPWQPSPGERFRQDRARSGWCGHRLTKHFRSCIFIVQKLYCNQAIKAGLGQMSPGTLRRRGHVGSACPGEIWEGRERVFPARGPGQKLGPGAGRGWASLARAWGTAADRAVSKAGGAQAGPPRPPGRRPLADSVPIRFYHSLPQSVRPFAL